MVVRVFFISMLAAVSFVALEDRALADDDAYRNKFVSTQAYLSWEAKAKRELDGLLEHAKLEKRRKEKAGDVPLTAEQERTGLEGFKFLLYNRAATEGICTERVLTADNSPAKLEECIEKRNAAMEKFIKLTDYQVSSRRCELKGRDFDSERRFPPFEFLRTGLGPPIFDFEIVNDCLMSKATNVR